MASESSPSSNNQRMTNALPNCGASQTLNMGGTLTRHQGNRQNILVERAFSSGTLRGTVTGQASPTSSACSSHLIYNTGTQKRHHPYDPHGGQAQQFHQINSQQQSPIHHADAKNFLHYNMMDEANQQNSKFAYYDRKTGSKTMKTQPSPHSPGQHDYFYFASPVSGDGGGGRVGVGSGAGINANTTGKQKHRKHNDDSFNTLNKQYGFGGKDDTAKVGAFPTTGHRKKGMLYTQQSAGGHSPPINSSIGKNSLGSDGMGGHSSHNSSTSNSKQQQSAYNTRLDGINAPFNGQEFNIRQSRLGYFNQQQQQQPQFGGNFGGYGPDEPVYEEILSNRMSDTEDLTDEIHNRNSRIRSRKPLNDSSMRDNDNDGADDPCLNDDDEQMHQNYRMRGGVDINSDAIPQHHLNR